MKTGNPSEIIFSAAEVARITGLDQLKVRALEPDSFGSPRDWRMVGGAIVYTEKGVEALVASIAESALLEHRSAIAAKLHAALVEERQVRTCPSRSLIPPAKKNSNVPYYQSHPTLS